MNKWIFLRGLARESRHWSGFVETFQNAFPETQVMPLDLPGTGKLIHEPAPWSVGQIVEFLRERIPPSFGKFSIFSVSLGSMVTLEWMNRYPGDLERAVLINVSASDLAPFYRRLRFQNFYKFAKALTHRDPEAREREVLSLISNNPSIHPTVANQWGNIYRQSPISATVFARQLFAAARFISPERKPKTPSLVLVGLGDRFVDPGCSEAVHKKYDWPIQRHPWAGHDLTLDDPEWVINAVRQWLESHKVAKIPAEQRERP